MLTINKLSKNYGAFQAVKELDLEVSSGELVTLLGPSGCGKSTTLRCIAGLETADDGEILLQDRPLSAPRRGIELPPERRNLGMVFQSYALWPHMSVSDNVAYPLRARKVEKREAARRAASMLDLVGLAAYGASKPGRLSGGQQQRVALARALASECEVLLFDEPLSNLDVRLRESMRHEIREIQTRLGITSIYVTHDQSEALAISDRIAVMDGGRIVQIGKPREIYEQPTTRFSATFLGSVNLLPVTRRGNSDGLHAFATENGTIVHSVRGEPAGGAVAYYLGLRSELIRLGEAPRDGQINNWEGEVRNVTFLGDSTEYVIGIFGTEIKALVPPFNRYGKGDKVRVSIAPEDCFVVAG